jgi:predicted dehydrogenase
MGLLVTGSYRELIDTPGIDWIYNALPPSCHFEFSAQAMRAGKNVLCEKPLCMNVAEASELRTIAQQTGQRLVHATSFPHHPRSIASQTLIRNGEIGDVRRVTVACTFADAFKRENEHRVDPNLGGGCLLDLGWYCVAATTWLTGLTVRSVQATGTKRSGVWESVQALATLSNGAIAHWDCGFDTASRKWIEVAGTEGSWICDDFIRPWDNAKPRYWIHGHAGKSRAESIGENFFQEVAMIDACYNQSDEWVASQLDEAVEIHRVLDEMNFVAQGS